jgi:hypothetical protein
MLKGISWGAFANAILCVVVLYYGCMAWVYRKDLLQWVRDRKQ